MEIRIHIGKEDTKKWTFDALPSSESCLFLRETMFSSGDASLFFGSSLFGSLFVSFLNVPVSGFPFGFAGVCGNGRGWSGRNREIWEYLISPLCSALLHLQMEQSSWPTQADCLTPSLKFAWSKNRENIGQVPATVVDGVGLIGGAPGGRHWAWIAKVC